jgi:branched-chain amino acid aminotransferase
MEKLKITLSKDLKEKPKNESDLGFGSVFTDHMFIMEHSKEKGWHNAVIKPFEDFTLSPAALVLHYAQTIFEGLKAYTGERLFRPWDNFARFQTSAKRMCIPEFDEKFVLECLYELIRIEKDWIPKWPGTSLYIRPTIIATDPYLGVKAADNYYLFIILSPVGAYYKSGFKPIKIYVENEYVRAVRGGVGNVKAGGNYGASILAGNIATEKGCEQVMWLDAIERRYVEEVGSMNIFFKINGELYTPPLKGSVLPGITRNSTIKMAQDRGFKVNEEPIEISKLYEASLDGSLEEIFGTGTAAIISSVGELVWGDKTILVNGGKMGELTQELYDELTGIQYGTVEDKYGWTIKL